METRNARQSRRVARDVSFASSNAQTRQSSARCKNPGTFTSSSRTIRALSTTSTFPHQLRRFPPGVGDKVVAKLDAWPSRHVNPEGHIVEVLGPAGSPGVDMLSIVRKYRLPRPVSSGGPSRGGESYRRKSTPESSNAARICATASSSRLIPTMPATSTMPSRWSPRLKDGVWAFTSPTCRIMSRPRSGLDREAISRGNSVYLADRVIPMLPEALSNGLCSLRPNEDHLTFSVFAEINRKGKVHSVRFAKTLIRSAARLTYKEALPTRSVLRSMRISRENFTSPGNSHPNCAPRGSPPARSIWIFPEVKVWLDAQGKPLRLEKIENDISHQLIEELMLLANELVARELMRRRQPSIYRVHEKPDADQAARVSRDGARPGHPLRRPFSSARTAKTTRLHSRQASGICDQARLAKKPQTRPLCARTAWATTVCTKQLHSLHQPDPALLGSRRPPRLGPLARTHKARAGFLRTLLPSPNTSRRPNGSPRTPRKTRSSSRSSSFSKTRLLPARDGETSSRRAFSKCATTGCSSSCPTF